MAVVKQETQQQIAPRKVPRLLERYRKEIAPSLAKTFGHANLLAVARIEKIVLNIGCGEAAHDAKILEAVQESMSALSGQRPVVTRAKVAISNFKIRAGDPVGCKVTLRRDRMYEFLDRLVSIALPRIRDFRGLNPTGFDQGGNYSFGIDELTIFPEVHPDRLPSSLGMDITLVTSAESREEALTLLKGFGMPFIKPSPTQAVIQEQSETVSNH